MTVSSDYTRWVTASVNKFFYSAAQAAKIYMYVEGMPNRQTQRHEDYYEMRHDGPYLREISQDEFKTYLEVNILVSVRQDTDTYRYDELIGIIVSAVYAGPIEVYKYGAKPQDTGDFIGCLYLKQEGQRDRLEVNRLERIEKEVRLRQAMIEGHYEGQFSLPA